MAIIPYANVVNVERLPIDAQDIITKVRIVIAGNTGGPGDPYYIRGVDDFNKTGAPNTGSSITTIPLPVVYEHEATEHATFGATRSFALPEGVNPFLPPTDALIPEPFVVNNFTNPGTPSAIRDGNPETYATLGSGNGEIIYSTNLPSCGWKLLYSLVEPPPRAWNRYVASLHRHISTGSVVRTLVQRNWEIVDTSAIDAPSDRYAISLHDARGEDDNLGSGWTRNSSYTLTILGGGSTEARVYAFYPLILNESLLEDIAQANVRLPAMVPQRVTVTGTVAPDREHTITGWPGGDFTGVVAQHQYELGRTVIDFEQAGAPTGLPAEAVEAARERTVAVKSEIQRSGYSVKMGERA